MTLQEGAKAVSGIVETFKSQPLVLALVLMNVALLGFLYYAISISAQSRKHEFELLVGNQRGSLQIQTEMKQELDVIKEKVVPR